MPVKDDTDLMHIAPAFDEDDMFVCIKVSTKLTTFVDEGGYLTSEVTDYEGVQVPETNKSIIVDPRDSSGPMARIPEEWRAILVQQKSYVHSYPYCWRCRKPLIYKAVSSWFVKVTTIHNRMAELNQETTWVPKHMRDGVFGN